MTAASKPHRFAIVVAGGQGTRMGQALPKQFLELHGQPILMHTLRRFAEAAQLAAEPIGLVVVLPEAHLPHWAKLIDRHPFALPHQTTAGGATRFQSVKNGLALLPETAEGLVAIHDGVRPLVKPKTINASFALAADKGTAVACVALKETIREVSEDGSCLHRDRSRYRLIQTPQTFRLPLIQAAYAQQEQPTFTDDASVAEAAGHAICLYPGHYENLKLTTPEDLKLAEALMD